jgi:hypothetical protein
LETITIVLLLLLAVILSGMVPLPLPRPLFQIALGALIGLGADWRVSLDPEIFFLLFLPPLLFLDGWRIPREELFKDGKTIVELALGLVIFTVVGIGVLIHWMIPAMPLARPGCSPLADRSHRRIRHRPARTDPRAHDAHIGRRVAAQRCLRSRVPPLCDRRRADPRLFGP